MQNLALVNILERKTKLHEPLHDDGLAKMLILLTHFLHMVCQITHYRSKRLLVGRTKLFKQAIHEFLSVCPVHICGSYWPGPLDC